MTELLARRGRSMLQGMVGEGPKTGGSQPYTAVGKVVGEIPVEISYRIIELFSAGLYSSPNKAVEELVSNAYDALASTVDLLITANLDDPSAAIWVVDDGQSMDMDGLLQLWRIARSSKRDHEDPSRPPIGKFGIGKLATYVLARQLTHICFQDGRYLAVTMDFGAIDPDQEAATKITLDVRELDRAAVEAALKPLAEIEGGTQVAERLLSAAAGSPWTAVAMSDLRPRAQDLRMGRLRWILSTALPLSPAFSLALNGVRIVPAVEDMQPLETWPLGAKEDVVKGVKGAQSGSDTEGPFVVIDGLEGVVRGVVEIYPDLLTTGKAAEWGRSHGFFVQVRGRLVNLDDALFGLPALSHGAFARFRMVVQADGLDAFLASTREAVIEGPPVDAFRSYLQAEFNEARKIFDSWAADQQHKERLATKLGQSPKTLSARPLARAISAVLDGSIDGLLLTDVPTGLTQEQKDELLVSIEAALESEAGLFAEVTLEPIDVEHFIAAYDPVARTVRINTLHPFFANYAEDYGAFQPFELFAVAEILTEAYLLDERVDAEAIRRVLTKRDQFLREFVATTRKGPAMVAQDLLDSVALPTGLEQAVAESFRSLGFEVSPIGGNGKPDGLAVARLGVRRQVTTERVDYKFTYDSKSTGGKAVSAHTVGVSTIARHRDDYGAQFAIVVAPGFDGGDTRESALGKECVTHAVMPITVRDLALLVRVAAIRQLGFSRLREMLETCRTPSDAHDWIQAELEKDPTRPPVLELLEVIWELADEHPDPVDISAIQVKLRDSRNIGLNRNQVVELVASLRGLAPGFVTFDGTYVGLETSVNKVVAEIAKHHSQLPADIIKRSYLQPLLDEALNDSKNAAP
ncbi:MAG: ATP-binding protein [Gemmatimonadota bacterium]|nr:ATP-binding protein [Gemmatimonadota bacterium]